MLWLRLTVNDASADEPSSFVLSGEAAATVTTGSSSRLMAAMPAGRLPL